MHDDDVPTRCDLLIRGGSLIDGSGAPRVAGDLAIVDDRIVACGDLDGVAAATTVDATGRVVAPGFIDVHTHDDRLLISGPDMTPKISQGVTTVVVGNCGVSLAPLVPEREPPPPLNLLGDRGWYSFPTVASYAAALDAEPAAVNVAMLCGHSTLRCGVMDDLGRPADEREIGRMGGRLDEALAAGCLGLSTGLAYPPAINAPTAEVVALCRHLAAHDALYTTHMRDERDGVVESVEETIAIGKEAGVRVVISHHKCSGRRNWGRSAQTLALIDRARGSMSLDLDVYPYVASSTVLLPDWLGDAERVLVTWSEPCPEHNGRDLADIAAGWGCDAVTAAGRLQPAGAIYFQMDEADLQRILVHDRTMIGSDGLPHDSVPHPRLWGTFPRVLGRYVRELGLLTLEQAVHRMTGIPAAVFRLADRGALRPGARADVVVFDPETVIDRASYGRPTEPAAGIDLVLVNGRPVWQGGAWSGARPGRLLRRA